MEAITDTMEANIKFIGSLLRFYRKMIPNTLYEAILVEQFDMLPHPVWLTGIHPLNTRFVNNK